MIVRLLLVAALALAPAVAVAAEKAPHTSARTLPTPLPLPYDEAADAHELVKAGAARAKAAGKFLLLDFGGNWCPDCRVMAGVLALKDVKPAIDRTFEVVAVDVGRFNKNLDIAAAYGVKIDAAPTVVILDRDGRFVNAGNPTALSNARDMTPQAIVDTLYGWITAR